MRKGHFRVVFFLPSPTSSFDYTVYEFTSFSNSKMRNDFPVNSKFSLFKPHPGKCSEELLSIHIAVNTFPEFSLAKLELYIRSPCSSHQLDF